jgi:phosphatidylglycerol:prolipoprotein diacylglycerol transferase
MHPILFQFGNIKVPTFGFILAIAFLAGIAMAGRRAPKFGFTSAQVSDVSFWALIAGVIGARLLYIALNWGYFQSNPRELVSLQVSGLTSFGGLIAGGFAVWIWCRQNSVDFLRMLDVFTPAFLVGHIIGRIGCLMNGCCFGGECPAWLPWAIDIHGHTHHPAQAYDSLMNVVALGAVLLYDRVRHPVGSVFGLGLVLHAITRFIYEFWRAGTREDVQAGNASAAYLPGLPVTEAQAFTLVLIAIGATIWFRAQSNRSAPVATA